MNDEIPPQLQQRTFELDRAPLIFVLLLLQAAIGLLETLVTLAFAGASPIGAGLGLLSATLTLALVVVAAGVVRGWRGARIAATVFEALVLLGAALRLLVRHGSLPGLVWLLSDVALPVAAIGLLSIHRPASTRSVLGAAQRETAPRGAATAAGSRPAAQA